MHLQKSDLAVRSIHMQATAYVRGNIEVNNYPNNSVDHDAVNDREIMNITAYESFNSTISLDLAMNGSMAFSPALSVVKDDPVEKSTWKQKSFVNLTLDWTGALDVTGLPENITDDLFTPDLAEWGVIGFPIDLAKIYNPETSGPQIDNGTLAVEAVEVEFEFSNLRNMDLADPVYGNITAYRQGFNNASQENNMELWFYPAEGSFVGARMTYPFTDMSSIVLDMRSVPVDEAQATEDVISDQVAGRKTYDQIAEVASKGFFDNPMNLLIVLAISAAAIIAIVGVVIVRKKAPPKA
jgi:hypothetical protein